MQRLLPEYLTYMKIDVACNVYNGGFLEYIVACNDETKYNNKG
jgi:hypothetical protein